MKYFSSILSSNLGNLLEWYDFGLFTIFSPLFSRLFFPSQDPHVALLATFSIFSIGFLCRPIGALLFGYLGDHIGRAKTLRFSILMISLPTFAIGCLPTYQSIGIFAPLFLTLIRMWQGISIGGEYSTNLVYLAETASPKNRGIFTSLASMSANIGIFLALLVGMITSMLFTEPLLQTWGFRIPYLLSGLFCLILYHFRLRMKESLTFDYLKQNNYLIKNPIKLVFKKNFPQLLRTLGLVTMGSTFYYFCFIYIPTYLSQHAQLSIRSVSTLMSIFIGLMIILVPLAGFVSDRVGRKRMLLFNATLITFFTIPGFYFLQFHNMMIIISVLLIFTIFSSLEQGATPASIIENFPLPARCTGVSLGYNLGNGFLGGTVPMVAEWLITHTHMVLAPAIYIAFCASITLLVVFFFVPTVAHKYLNIV